MSYLVATAFLELFFVTDIRFQVRSRNLGAPDEPVAPVDNATFILVKFLCNKLLFRPFPSLFEKLKHDDPHHHSFIKSMKKVFSRFDKNCGGTNRKILLSLLLQNGANSHFLANISGVTERHVRRAHQQVTQDHLKQFFARFRLSKKKRMYSDRELAVVGQFFAQSCPSNSYSTKKEYRQICGDATLYKKYIKYVSRHNSTNLLKDPTFEMIRIRCYDVFLAWKREYKVRKTTKEDLDFNCQYCFDLWTVRSKIWKKNSKLEGFSLLLGSLQGKDSYTPAEHQKMNSLNEKITKIKEQLADLESRKKELEKHMKLKKIQRERIEKIEQDLKDNQILVFFDFSKYNWAVHDLCFVVVYKEPGKEIRSRRAVHYLHNKWADDGRRIANDGKYAVSAMKLFMSKLDEWGFGEHELYLASDGGKHFVCAEFMTYFTSLIVEEYNRYAPHHGGNYCDLEFGMSKSALRRYEQKVGYQVKDATLLKKVLSDPEVTKRHSEFVVLTKIDTDHGYTFRSPAFPNGIRNWYCLFSEGETKKLNYAETHQSPEWSVQVINATSTTYMPPLNLPTDVTDEEMEDEEEEENDSGEEDGEIEHIRHCCVPNCGLPIEENNGYLRCITCDAVFCGDNVEECPKQGYYKCHGCPSIVCSKRSCMRRSYNPQYDGVFKYRECNKW